MNDDENEIDADEIEELDEVDFEGHLKNHRPPKKIGVTVDRVSGRNIYEPILQERPDLDITQPRNP